MNQPAPTRAIDLESELFGLLIEAFPDALLVVDSDGRILRANSQSERIFGYRPEELNGQVVELLVPEQLAAGHVAHREQFSASPQARSMSQRDELHARRRDGSVFPVEINLNPMASSAGAVTIASIRDISLRKSIEARERRETELSASLINSLPGISFMIDSDGRMYRWNTNLEKLSGIEASAIEDGDPTIFFYPDVHQRIREAISRCLEQGFAAAETMVKTPDGPVGPYRFIGQRIELDGALYVAGMGIDISELKQTESALHYVTGLQRMVVEASRRLLVSGTRQLDELITATLGEIGAYCRADRSYLFRFKQDRKLMDNTHEWCSDGTTPEKDNLQNLPRASVPEVVRGIEQQQVVHIPDTSVLGPEWSNEREIFEAQQIQSLILVPVIIGGEVFGFAGFDAVRDKRTWDEEEIRLLQVLADLIGSAILRQTGERALKASEARYRSLVNNIREIVFQIDQAGRWTFLNPAWEKITGHPIEDCLGRPALSFIHPDQQQGAKSAMRSILEGQIRFSRQPVQYLNAEGGYGWLEANVQPVTGDGGQITGLTGTLRDVTEQREAQRKILNLAHYDPVTGLPNRVLALDRLEQLLKGARRYQEHVAVLFLDLDHFKKVNDTLGHEAGDELLRLAAERLLTQVREQDTVARFGGDEFLVLFGGLHEPAEVQPLTEKVLNCFRQPFHLRDRELLLTASIGLALAPSDGDVAQELLRNADMAMYESKARGRNTYQFFTRAMNRSVGRRLAIEEQLRYALDRGEITVAYQPVIDLADNAVVGAEALVRWHNPVLGELDPDEFIPIAEQIGMIDSIGQAVLQRALALAARWRPYQERFCISVNVSPQQFRDLKLVSRLEQALAQSGLPGRALQIEITENVLLSSHDQASDALGQMRRLGVSLAMDDFGTGYASLSYLRQFPIDTLKIDRSFVCDIHADARNRELVIASIALARSLGLLVVAEGVESAEQLKLLRQHGCQLAQGFYLGRPMPEDAFNQLMEREYTTILPLPREDRAG